VLDQLSAQTVDRRGLQTMGRGRGAQQGPVAPVEIGVLPASPQGNDRMSGDFPMVNGQPTLPVEWKDGSWARNTAKQQSAMSNSQLLAVFRREYSLASHRSPVTTAQSQRFASSAGGTVVSMPGSVMSSLVSNSREGSELGNALTARLKAAAETQERRSSRVDVSRLRIKLDPDDRPSWGMNLTSPLFGLVGSTDGLSANLLNPKYDVGSRNLTGTLRITVVDRFGLSNSDNDSPGQIAMWLLQHQRGFKSFENRIVYDVPVDLTLKPPPVPNCAPKTACPREF
jgi:hypothetical protein